MKMKLNIAPLMALIDAKLLDPSQLETMTYVTLPVVEVLSEDKQLKLQVDEHHIVTLPFEGDSACRAGCRIDIVTSNPQGNIPIGQVIGIDMTNATMRERRIERRIPA